MVKEESTDFKPCQFTTPESVYEAFKHLSKASQEEMHIIALNAKNMMIDSYMVSRGSLTASIVHPREVFKFLFLQNAASFIMVHNHPSGDISVSQEDYEITNRLTDCGFLLGIKLLDHIIIGKNQFKSLLYF
jgi:DNA repair protein RadC